MDGFASPCSFSLLSQIQALLSLYLYLFIYPLCVDMTWLVFTFFLVTPFLVRSVCNVLTYTTYYPLFPICTLLSFQRKDGDVKRGLLLFIDSFANKKKVSRNPIMGIQWILSNCSSKTFSKLRGKFVARKSPLHSRW